MDRYSLIFFLSNPYVFCFPHYIILARIYILDRCTERGHFFLCPQSYGKSPKSFTVAYDISDRFYVDIFLSFINYCTFIMNEC